MAEWQPIETAEKEPGKFVLLFGDGAHLANVVFVGWYGYGGGSSGPGWWQLGVKDHQAKPTHWMPLPDPPNVAHPRLAAIAEP